jgi:hypothetical protein
MMSLLIDIKKINKYLSTGVCVNLIYKYMRDFNFIKENFIQKHKTIDKIEYLDKYIKSIIEYKSNDQKYIEKHHILPRSTFPELENESWNIIELDYETHRLAHLYLFKAINDRRYQRPLNWMMNYYKNSEEISNAAKRGWVNLKNDEVKYNKWREKKSESMKLLSTEEQRRRANIFWNNIDEEDYLKFCEKMKSYWTEEKRFEKSKQMNEYYSNPNNVEKKRRETKDRWDSLDDSYRKNFKEKMSFINKNESKRLDAGNKIKKKWKDPDYLEKMRNRKKRNGLKIKITKIDGSVEIFENMEDIVRKYNFSTHLIRKYRDTNSKVLEKHLNSDNINLLEAKIETIKK